MISVETLCANDEKRNEVENNETCQQNKNSINEEIKVNFVEESQKIEEMKGNEHKISENIINDAVKEGQCGKESIYKSLLELQKEYIVLYPSEFECLICLEKYGGNNGVILKGCLHIFCLECIRKSVLLSGDVDVKCPYSEGDTWCPGLLEESEIRSLLSGEEYSVRLERTLAAAEIKEKEAFHCRNPDCGWWFVNEYDLGSVECGVCKLRNCIPCGAIHTGVSCEEFGEGPAYRHRADVGKSETLIADMVGAGTAMYCPVCTAVLQKQGGCDHITCFICKTNLNWQTKGPY